MSPPQAKKWNNWYEVELTGKGFSPPEFEEHYLRVINSFEESYELKKKSCDKAAPKYQIAGNLLSLVPPPYLCTGFKWFLSNAYKKSRSS